MKIVLSILLLMLFVPCSFPAYGAPAAAADPADATAARVEFEELFAQSPIYQAIRVNLPESYEDFFQTYLAARRSGTDEIPVAAYINSVRNTYLKQSSDESVLAFFRYTVEVGSDILAKDPEAAYAYLFGGNPDAYAKYIDYAVEQKKLGELYDRILSTRSRKNLQALDAGKAEEGMDFVNVLLMCKYGEAFYLLTKDNTTLGAEDRQRLCVIYLDMFNEIFQLAPATRSHLLRSFTARM